jgi:acylphosphatase
MAVERRVIRVFGHVQGVFFRQSARREALRLGLHGFARNEHDGSVIIDVQGAPAALDELVDWAHHGPAAATVDRVEVEIRDPVGQNSFRIL